MRILFDQGTPVPLRDVLTSHQVETAFERGWHTLTNGALIEAAVHAGFECILTTDQNLRYQQNLANRRFTIVVLPTTNWRSIQANAAIVIDALRRPPPVAIFTWNSRRSDVVR